MHKALCLIVALGMTGPVAAQTAAGSGQAAAAVRPPAQIVARVNGAAISETQLAIAVNAKIPLQSYHRNVDAEKLADIRSKALDDLIDEELRYQDGVRRGIAVTTAEVDSRLGEIRRQYGGRQKLDEVERKAGVSVTELRREIRRALTVKKAFASTVTAKCQVPREEAIKYFRDNPDQFVEPEQVHVFAITFGVDPGSPAEKWTAAKKQAEDVLVLIRKGASFEEMARTRSTDPSKSTGGDMGLIHRGAMSDEVEKATHNLPMGEARDVVQSLYGYHVVKVSDIQPPQPRTFAEVGTVLQKDLTTQRCTEMSDAWTARLRATATVDTIGSSPKGPASTKEEAAEADVRTP